MSKIILVTGSNSSIGFELVRILAEKGHTVYLSARNEEAGLEAQKILHAKGLTNVKFVLLDIRDTASIERAKNTIEEAEGRLDALVNNAAISRNDTLRRASELDIAVFKDIMETNFVGLVQTTAAFVPLLRKSSAPSIVNVSSGLGSSTYQTRRGHPTLFTAYAVSKAAVNSYTVNLSQDLEKEGFKVNAVCPGLVSSRLNNFMEGGKSLEAGAQAIEPFVLLDKDAPTGKFYSQGVEMEW